MIFRSVHMKKIAFLTAVFILTIFSASLFAGEQPEQPKKSKADLALIESYLKTIGATYKKIDEQHLTFRAGTKSKLDTIQINADPEKFFVYMGILDVFHVSSTDKSAAAVLTAVADLNYRLVMGKLEWDSSTGEIRLSYTFSTEDGLGYNSFYSVLMTLLTELPQVRAKLGQAGASVK